MRAECARGCIPQQGIVGERGDGVAQAVDIAALVAISVVFWLMLSVLAAISVVFCAHWRWLQGQLRAVNGVGAAF